MNSISIELLEDGRVRITTADFSAATHMSAEDLLAWLEGKLGRVVDKQKLPKTKHQHVHVNKARR